MKSFVPHPQWSLWPNIGHTTGHTIGHTVCSLIATFFLMLSAGAAVAQVQVQGAWVKAAGPSQMATAAYMNLTATQPVRITGAESPVASVVELHQMAIGPNDTMTMRAVPVIELAAGQSVELKPGGLHVMLMDLNRTPLKPGDTVNLTLIGQTADGKALRVPVSASVKPVTAKDGRSPALGQGHSHH